MSSNNQSRNGQSTSAARPTNTHSVTLVLDGVITTQSITNNLSLADTQWQAAVAASQSHNSVKLYSLVIR